LLAARALLPLSTLNALDPPPRLAALLAGVLRVDGRLLATACFVLGLSLAGRLVPLLAWGFWVGFPACGVLAVAFARGRVVWARFCGLPAWAGFLAWEILGAFPWSFLPADPATTDPPPSLG
jgi:hypothetical protein